MAAIDRKPMNSLALMVKVFFTASPRVRVMKSVLDMHVFYRTRALRCIRAFVDAHAQCCIDSAFKDSLRAYAVQPLPATWGIPGLKFSIDVTPPRGR
jgi:AmiR/NasT family two-component response regulator